MFKVKEKSTGKIVTVYEIKETMCGFIEFLIYSNKEWQYVSSKSLEPIEE